MNPATPPINPPTTRQCWFCYFTEIRSVLNCTRCSATIIPSKDLNGSTMEWAMVYTFGNDLPAADRCPNSVFAGALEDFATRNGVAIRVASNGNKYLLVRHPQCNMRVGSFPPEFSVRKVGLALNDLLATNHPPAMNGPPATKGRLITVPWTVVSDAQKQAFRDCLNGRLIFPIVFVLDSSLTKDRSKLHCDSVEFYTIVSTKVLGMGFWEVWETEVCLNTYNKLAAVRGETGRAQGSSRWEGIHKRSEAEKVLQVAAFGSMFLEH